MNGLNERHATFTVDKTVPSTVQEAHRKTLIESVARVFSDSDSTHFIKKLKSSRSENLKQGTNGVQIPCTCTLHEITSRVINWLSSKCDLSGEELYGILGDSGSANLSSRRCAHGQDGFRTPSKRLPNPKLKDKYPIGTTSSVQEGVLTESREPHP